MEGFSTLCRCLIRLPVVSTAGLPREIDLIGVREKNLRDICRVLNSTHRKCLGYRTPAEVFSGKLRGL
jgi:IS30 family transposase